MLSENHFFLLQMGFDCFIPNHLLVKIAMDILKNISILRFLQWNISMVKKKKKKVKLLLVCFGGGEKAYVITTDS